MKAAQAKKILECSYTTLHNYVKQGKLKLSSDPLSKQQEYDDASVYDLSDRLIGKKKFNNTVIVFKDNEKSEFNVDEFTLNKILDILNVTKQDFY